MFDENELKQIQLDMLKQFIDICEKYKLQYFLLGGSALGAVRHKGFIPWDDDIDVGMPREHYEMFLKIAQANLPNDIFLQTAQTDPDYWANFAKLRNSDTTFIEKTVKAFNINHGVYIDIFPLDGYEGSAISNFAFRLYKARVGYQFYLNDALSLKSKLKKSFLCMLIPDWKKARDKKGKIIKKKMYQNCDTVHNFCGAWGKKEIMPKSYFGNGTKAEFEGIEVVIPEQYDLYLTQMYGDYMALPPKDKQIPHHYTEIIDLSKSYKNYI